MYVPMYVPRWIYIHRVYHISYFIYQKIKNNNNFPTKIDDDRSFDVPSSCPLFCTAVDRDDR